MEVLLVVEVVVIVHRIVGVSWSALPPRATADR